MKNNRLKRIFCLIIMIIFASAFLACEPTETPKTHNFSKYDFLYANKEVIMNGYNEKISLRGTNAGGYLVMEQWMTAFKGSEQTGYLDHKMTTEIFVNRFGKDKTIKLWDSYRENFWTEQDFINCSNMGMNVIRLPFSYMSVDTRYNNVKAKNGERYNFTILDKFIDLAEKYKIYTILDLHGAYGSQNGQDHSGEQMDSADKVDFFYNEEKQNLTIELWKAIANHYKENPAVAGYDILNEPGEKAGVTTERHWAFYDKAYKAIRAVDEKHIVIFESCWEGENLPSPTRYGWENCMYSVHNYSGSNDSETNLTSMQNKINGVKKMNFGVPILMGEFNCYGNEESWKTTLNLFNENGWHWTSWTYKLNSQNNNALNGWGIYVSTATPIVPDTDSYEIIQEKWQKIRTESEQTQIYTFNSGKTLYEIMNSGIN